MARETVIIVPAGTIRQLERQAQLRAARRRGTAGKGKAPESGPLVSRRKLIGAAGAFAAAAAANTWARSPAHAAPGTRQQSVLGAAPAGSGAPRRGARHPGGAPAGVTGDQRFSCGGVTCWSVFSFGAAAAAAWAGDLLMMLGLPASGWRLRFVYDWEASEGGGGLWNPVNQGPVPGRPDLTSTGQQFGGGAANYVSWQAGLQGAFLYLHMGYYAAVLDGLARRDYWTTARALWASPWAGSHYGYGSAWHASAAGH